MSSRAQQKTFSKDKRLLRCIILNRNARKDKRLVTDIVLTTEYTEYKDKRLTSLAVFTKRNALQRQTRIPIYIVFSTETPNKNQGLEVCNRKNNRRSCNRKNQGQGQKAYTSFIVIATETPSRPTSTKVLEAYNANTTESLSKNKRYKRNTEKREKTLSLQRLDQHHGLMACRNPLE